MSTGESITIKNIHLLDLKRWLDLGLPAGTLNRNRNEFLRMLKPFADDLEQARLEILKRFVVKDEDGKQDLIKAEFASPEDKASAEKEYDTLINETVSIPVTKPVAVDTVKNILKTMDRKMGNLEGERFDEVAEILGISFE